MPQYRYIAFSAEGKREDGVVDFGSEGQAWDSLCGLGLTIVELVPLGHTASMAKPLSGLFSNQIPLGVQADVAEQLSVLTQAHLQATEIVALVARSNTHGAVRRCFERMTLLLADGVGFDQAFDQAARGFVPLFGAMVRVSQTTSDPCPVLRNLAAHLRKQQHIQAQLSGALIYPLILLCGGIAVFLLVVLYLAPALQPMFVSLGRDVPGPIGVFLAMGEGLKAYGLHFALGLAALAVAASLGLRRNPMVLRALTLHLPIVGPIARDSALARLTRSLSLMLAAGIPLAPALRDTGKHLGTEVFAPEFLSAAEAVESGALASSIFDQASALPVMFRELFLIGEQTNSLARISDSIASVLEDGVERQTHKAVQLVTPFLTLVMGGGLALLVYTIMDAILSVNDLAF